MRASPSSSARAGAEMLYPFEQPFIVDSPMFATTATSYEAGIEATSAWYWKDP